VHTILGTPVGMVSKGEQRGDVAIGDQPNIAAFATVASVRPSERFGAFSAERRTAGATIAAAYIQLRFIDEPAHRTS
jgi:hypothetical protein